MDMNSLHRPMSLELVSTPPPRLLLLLLAVVSDAEMRQQMISNV